jgi:general secretion pathway protein G
LKQVCFRRKGGLSLVELIMTLSILSILAALILPSARMMSKRTKEIELKRNLRIIRNAIDDFKKTYDKECDTSAVTGASTTGNQSAGSLSVCPEDKKRYPKDFDDLVKEFDFNTGKLKKTSKRFLRKIPCDPFATDKLLACEETWGLRSSSDKPDSTTTDKENLYDVFSKSDETAIDGSKYKDW